MANEYSYPDKLGFPETIMFHIRAMSHELASEGLVEEYEDMVDALAWMVWTYMEESERGLYDEYDVHGAEVHKHDREMWDKSKRHRCKMKMRLIFQVLDRCDILLRKVQSFGFEGEYLDLPVEAGK